MTSDFWTHLGDVAPAALHDAMLELHWATQVLAGAGQTFVAERTDDSHRALTWSDDLMGFVGEAFTEGYPFRVALKVEDLTLRLLQRDGSSLGALALGGVTLDDAYAWVRAGLSQYMGGTGPEIQRPDFEIPGHRVGEGAPFAMDRTGERRTLTALYAGAADVLRQVQVHARDTWTVPAISAVRCWPHHFDIATLLTVAPARGDEAARTVGVGMAPMGGGYDAWYWYVTPWPYPEPTALPELEGPGRWHTDGWTGAVLAGDDVVALAPAERRDRVVSFLLDSGDAVRRTLAD